MSRPLRDQTVAAWWAALAVALLAIGQSYFLRHLPVIDGVIFTGVGLAAFWRGLKRARPATPLPVAGAGESQPPAIHAAVSWGWSRHASITATTAVVLTAFGLGLVLSPGILTAQALVLGASLAWLLLGAQLAGGIRPVWNAARGPAADAMRRDGPWLLLILALAAAVRLTGLDTLPAGLWFDEAGIGLEAERILRDPGYKPMYALSTTSPAAFVYLVAGAEGLLGHTVAAVRLVPALSGVLTSLLAYATGRLLWGGWLGLAAALLFAVARWDVNFSRIGMQGATTPTLLVAVFALACLSVRTRHPAAYAALGVLTGSLFWFYGANVFFLPVLLVALVLLCVRPSDGGRGGQAPALRSVRSCGFLRFHAPGLGLAAVGALLVAAPVFADGMARPEVVFSRAETVSVFRDRSLGEALPVVRETLVKHLAMFHLEGDRNGRHNLPGAPMLDPITGVLMLLGLATAVYSLQQPVMAALIAWLFLLLLPGVLSIPYEAPQGLRAIGALPAALLLAALGLQRLWSMWSPRMGLRPAGLLLGAILIAITGINLRTYFVAQASHPDVWSAFSMAPSIIGRHLATAGDTETLVSVFFHNHPSVQFLGGAVPSLLEPALHLPVSGSKDTTIFMSAPEEESVYRLARTYYPDAACDAVRHSSDAQPVLYRCDVPAAMMRATQGLGPPTQDQLTGSLQAPSYGPYRLGLDASSGLMWSLNGQSLGRGGGVASELLLPQGMHEVIIRRAPDAPGVPILPAALLWQPPGGEWGPVPQRRLSHGAVRPVGLAATYYQNPGWSGTPALRRMEPGAATYYHVPPFPFPFSVEWNGQVHVPRAGQYGFSVEAIGDASVEIDGRPVVSSNQPNVTKEAHLPLSEGWYNLRVRHLAGQGYAHIFVRWLPPGGRWELIPPDRMRPW